MRHTTFFSPSFWTKRHRLSALKKHPTSLYWLKILFVHSDYQHRRFSALAIFFIIKSSWFKSAKTDLFCSFPGACRGTRPLEPLKQTELMLLQLCSIVALLLRGSVRPLASATSAGSRAPLFVQDQWACPCQGLWDGHWSVSWVFGLSGPPDPSLTALPTFSYAICTLPRSEDYHAWENVHNIWGTFTKCKREGAPCREHAGCTLWACVTRFYFVVQQPFTCTPLT